MNPSFQFQPEDTSKKANSLFIKVLRCCIGYCVLSCVTLPFIGHVWLGELPVLALLQLPKIEIAGWLRTHVVMKVITFLGCSSGSFSPDYIQARPYALAIVYMVPLFIIGMMSFRWFRFTPDRRNVVTVTLFFAAAVDYIFTLMFADLRSLTIY